MYCSGNRCNEIYICLSLNESTCVNFSRSLTFRIISSSTHSIFYTLKIFTPTVTCDSEVSYASVCVLQFCFFSLIKRVTFFSPGEACYVRVDGNFTSWLESYRLVPPLVVPRIVTHFRLEIFSVLDWQYFHHMFSFTLCCPYPNLGGLC